MAKGSNPADAHRKQLKKKELAKNKEQRKKTREISTVKRDTRSLETDIRKLTQQAQQGPLNATDKAELAELRAELARVTKAKQECKSLRWGHSRDGRDGELMTRLAAARRCRGPPGAPQVCLPRSASCVDLGTDRRPARSLHQGWQAQAP